MTEPTVYDVVDKVVIMDPDAPLWAQELASNQMEMTAILATIMAKFDSVAGEVKPVIDSLSGNPMFRMFVGKGK